MQLSKNIRAQSPHSALPCIMKHSTVKSTDFGGDRARTDDLLLAKQALSQLSYTPLKGVIIKLIIH